MSKTIFQNMHAQHVKWQHDLDAWLADIDEWKKELRAALTNLTDLEALLRDSLDGMETHANTVWEAQQRIKAHEAIISEESRAGENKTDKEWETAHKEVSSQHEHVFEVHERIKKYHHTVTAEIVKLLSDARKGM